jgi:hypothetical protein
MCDIGGYSLRIIFEMKTVILQGFYTQNATNYRTNRTIERNIGPLNKIKTRCEAPGHGRPGILVNF